MKMNYEEIKKEMCSFLLNHPHNYIEATDAIRDDLVGMQIYEAPVFAVGDACDPMFNSLREPQVVHTDYRLPLEWNPEAKCVISYFLPYTKQIKHANRQHYSKVSDEWLHARIEGQEMLNYFGVYLRDSLEREGFKSVLPSMDKGYRMLTPIISNWSERHTGFICGLGTFGLSKGIITEKGMAGRLGSVISAAELPISKRSYTEIYEYCSRCRKCEKTCPADAIDMGRGMRRGKSHQLCEPFLDSTHTRKGLDGNSKDRYGCGKCQVNVPCESRRP